MVYQSNEQARIVVEKLHEDMDDNGQETQGSRRTVRQGAASHGRTSGRRASEIDGSPPRFYGARDRNHGSLVLASVFDPAQFRNIAAGDSPRGGEEARFRPSAADNSTTKT